MLDRAYVEKLSERFTDIREHLLTLYDLAVKINAKIIVELGAGQSTYALMAAANKTGGQLWSIDVLEDAYLREWPQGKQDLKLCDHLTQIVADDIYIGNGWEDPIDFLFIDTSHQYEHTLNELKIWTPLVRKGGIICMHDTHHTVGHAVRCREALDYFLKENPDDFLVTHFPNCGGLSILTKLK